jgi:hypothetical protein
VDRGLHRHDAVERGDARMRIVPAEQLAVHQRPRRAAEPAKQRPHGGDQRRDGSPVAEERVAGVEHGAPLRDRDLGPVGTDAEIRAVDLLARDPGLLVERAANRLVRVPGGDAVDDLGIGHEWRHAGS